MSSGKLKLFIQGHRGLLGRIRTACAGEKDIIWFHVASFGEFEEARPVIEATRARFPERKILLTVFSPTVYVPMQHYDKVNWVFYLPLDTRFNVRRFLDAVRPVKAIFTITDYWPNLLGELRRRKIDTYIISVRIEPDSHHLKWWDFNYRKIFRHCYKTVMVQNAQSREILLRLGVPDVRVTGDPRMDRVLSISAEKWEDPIVKEWCGGKKVFVAGSTYAPEHQMLLEIANRHPEEKFLIVPHELEESKIQAILAGSQHGATRYTDFHSGAQILVADTVGILSRLYRYGYAAYVGGCFTEGAPHSVIEPAAYGMPVAFGPAYQRDHHCKDLIQAGAGVSIANARQLEAFLLQCRGDYLEKASAAARDYCTRSAGATGQIMDIIFGD
ncbi:MAG: 3-deoxy-D-manno-octulosonic acid transferase [Bacteroidales bacterium]|nr:3-deoxy-D-manno-octulosonic acid transferase [Bacteroidales bacterium]